MFGHHRLALIIFDDQHDVVEHQLVFRCEPRDRNHELTGPEGVIKGDTHEGLWCANSCRVVAPTIEPE